MIIEPTWKRAAKVWLAYLLRGWIVRFSFIFFHAISFNLFNDLLSINSIVALFYASYVIFTIVYVELYIIKRTLTQGFGEFRLVLVKTTDAEE